MPQPTSSARRIGAASPPSSSQPEPLRQRQPLSIVSLAHQAATVPYATLQAELDIAASELRQLEDLVIETIYAGLLDARLNQKEAVLVVRRAASRDVRLSEIDGMIAKLRAFMGPAGALSQALHATVADAWVDRLGIGALVSDEPGSFGRLSQGQQKLALLARALVKSPRLLVLDEPTHALSRMSRGRFLGALAAVRGEPDVAVLYVTHRRDEIAALAVDRVLDLKTS